MQILEASLLGLRSARIKLSNPKSRIIVTLFPMVHAAEASFYQETYDDAFSHDAALVEGIKSPIGRRLTRSYRWFIGSKRLNLSLQPPWPEPDTCRARIILSDLSAEEFVLAWRKVPLWLRWLVQVAAPMMGLWMRLFGTREMIAKRAAMDDQPSQAELLSWNPELAWLDGALLDARDNRLIEHIGSVLDGSNGEIQRLAVVYGAAHMRAALRFLTERRGYIAHDSEWRTVFHL